jgi:hypothetical protein
VSCWYWFRRSYELLDRKTVKIWVIVGDITKKMWDGQGEIEAISSSVFYILATTHCTFLQVERGYPALIAGNSYTIRPSDCTIVRKWIVLLA